jgi:TonB family protein
MRIRASLATICVLLVALPPNSLGRNDKEEVDAQALLAKAKELSDIRAEGSPAFRLHASIDFPSAGDPKLGQGSYLEIWESPDHWRREVKGVGYEEVSVRAGSKLYRKANMPYRPWPLFHLELLFRTQDPHGSPRNVVAPQVKVKKLGGPTVICVEENSKRRERHWKVLARFTYCVNRDNGLLSSVESYLDRMEYAAYARLGAREYPQSLRWSFGGQAFEDAHVDTLSLLTNVSPNLFEPPEGAEESRACERSEPPRKISGREPDYTPSARAANIQGSNESYVVVSRKGEVIHAEIIRSLEPSLDAATLDVIRQWQYRPATCDGSPMDEGFVMQTSFRRF